MSDAFSGAFTASQSPKQYRMQKMQSALAARVMQSVLRQVRERAAAKTVKEAAAMPAPAIPKAAIEATIRESPKMTIKPVKKQG